MILAFLLGIMLSSESLATTQEDNEVNTINQRLSSSTRPNPPQLIGSPGCVPNTPSPRRKILIRRRTLSETHTSATNSRRHISPTNMFGPQSSSNSESEKTRDTPQDNTHPSKRRKLEPSAPHAEIKRSLSFDDFSLEKNGEAN